MKRALIAVAIGCIAATATAHQGSITYAKLRVEERSLLYELQIPLDDLAEPLDLPSRPALSLVAERDSQLFDYVARRIAVLNNGRECLPEPIGLTSARKLSGEFADLKLRFACERRPERVEVRYHLFLDIDGAHQSFTTVHIEAATRQHVFRQGARTLRIDRDVSPWQHAWDYLILGIEHISGGYDHICFLLGLLVVGVIEGRTGARRPIRRGILYTFGVVTAFTAAHSITLILATLGWVLLPSRLVESVIALSIAYVGAENLLRQEPTYRWLLTFVFGLVHGFGFAGVLRDIGLPDRGLLLSLLSFNLGVELGQIAIVLLVFPFLYVGAALGFYQRWIVGAGSGAILLLALLWFVERAFDVQFLGGALG